MEWKPILKFYEQFDNYHIVNVDFTVIYCKICFYTHPVSANLQYDIILLCQYILKRTSTYIMFGQEHFVKRYLELHSSTLQTVCLLSLNYVWILSSHNLIPLQWSVRVTQYPVTARPQLGHSIPKIANSEKDFFFVFFLLLLFKWATEYNCTYIYMYVYCSSCYKLCIRKCWLERF